MESKELSFVTTTVNKPTFVEKYLNKIQPNEVGVSDVEFKVVGDLKTPLEVGEYCSRLDSKYDVDVHYLGVEDQQEWCADQDLGALARYLPYNSIQRRNIGYLMAYHQGADVIVSLDDDNLAHDEDIAAKFATVGEKQQVLEVSARNGWFNCASMLRYESEESRDIYHRGFPYSKRDEQQQYSFTHSKKKVMVRAGLWLDVPDIDVITHLERSPRAIALKDEYKDKLVALGNDIYCPVNTQNTAFHVDLMPLIHTIPMGHKVDGLEVSRFDDIWLGFFAEKIMHSMGDTVAYGRPLSMHDRNVHNLKKELEHEAIGIRLNEHVVHMMENIDIDESSYMACYFELIDKMRNQVENINNYPFQAYFKRMLDGMEVWAQSCKKISS